MEKELKKIYKEDMGIIERLKDCFEENVLNKD